MQLLSTPFLFKKSYQWQMGLNPRHVFHVVFLFFIAVFKSEDKNLKFFMFFLKKCSWV